MNHYYRSTDTNPEILRCLIPTTIFDGIDLMLRAYHYAHDVQMDVQDFALEIGLLFEQGMNHNDLRWLMAKNLICHGIEHTSTTDQNRAFDLDPGILFQERSCFWLSPKGARFAESNRPSQETMLGSSPPEMYLDERPDKTRAKQDTPKPHWDAGLRELTFEGVVVKKYKVPAPNQETILSVFEEESWIRQIDDPIPPNYAIDTKGRLHNTIKRLNRNQKNRLISFHGNGQGTGVIWSLIFKPTLINDSLVHLQ